MSTAYHPQTDGQTELVNKCLECYLRCMTRESPKDWTLWLPLAEYWYNTNYHSAIKTTPFKALYGQPPALYIPYVAKDSRVELVDKTLYAREKAIQIFDWVYLKLQPYRQVTLRKGKQHKLSSKFYGLFQVIAKVGKVAYKLQFPDNAKVHLVFHVSQLKKCLSSTTTMGTFLECDAQGLIAAEPVKLLDRKMVKQQNRMGVFGLIQ
ncbi:retrotransposable element Tf2 [Tanacetum coccineum]|uniref:Retrotransposable element Tf2 n=1 Tax=Tanacetum coccineum TaxID=301880 RepID=A0ABQ4Z9G3_9ASTR